MANGQVKSDIPIRKHKYPPNHCKVVWWIFFVCFCRKSATAKKKHAALLCVMQVLLTKQQPFCVKKSGLCFLIGRLLITCPLAVLQDFSAESVVVYSTAK